MQNGGADNTWTMIDKYRLWDLVADAIVCAYLPTIPHPEQTTEDKVKFTIPFLYNLLDYLLIALPEGSNLLIVMSGSTVALSTETGGPSGCQGIDVETLGVPFDPDDDPDNHLWLVAVSPAGADGDHRHTVHQVLDRARSLAKARGPTLRSRHLTETVKLLLDHPADWAELDCLEHQLHQGTSFSDYDPDVLESIIRNVAGHLTAALTETDGSYELVLRYWAAGEPKFVTLNKDLTTPPAEWRESIKRVFETGFVRWWRDGNDVVVGIPCHVFGMPWLLSCRRVLGIATDPAAQWWAYTTYRVHSILNATLRRAARTSLASEMHRLLRATDTRGAGQNDPVRAAEEAWGSLQPVYPVTRPRLREARTRAPEASREYTLTIRGQEYEVFFDEAPNRFFPQPTLPPASRGAAFGPIDAETANQHFLLPAQMDYYREQVEAEIKVKDSKIAANESAIQHYGHTMGHRIAPVVAYFNQQDGHTEAGACARQVAEMSLILQAYAVREDEFFRLNTEKEGRFVDYLSSLDLLQMLADDIQPISAKDVPMDRGIVYRYPLPEIVISAAQVDRELDDPYHNTKCRLHRAFFGQLLSELFINAVQHGYHADTDEKDNGKSAGVRLRIQTITLNDRPALVISNYFKKRRGKRIPDFFAATWRPWPKTRENDGPGMAIAVFRALNAGDMWLMAEPPTNDEPGILHVALTFKGLRISKAG